MSTAFGEETAAMKKDIEEGDVSKRGAPSSAPLASNMHHRCHVYGGCLLTPGQRSHAHAHASTLCPSPSATTAAIASFFTSPIPFHV